MTRPLDFTTPQQALRAMLAAGAVFSVRRSADSLGLSFSYSVRDDGDIERCRAILAAARSRPSAFFEGFKAQIQDAAAADERGAA